MILFCIDLQNFFPHSGCSEQQDIISGLTNIRDETEKIDFGYFWLEMAFICCCIISLVFKVLLYKWDNAKRGGILSSDNPKEKFKEY